MDMCSSQDYNPGEHTCKLCRSQEWSWQGPQTSVCNPSDGNNNYKGKKRIQKECRKGVGMWFSGSVHASHWV